MSLPSDIWYYLIEILAESYVEVENSWNRRSIALTRIRGICKNALVASYRYTNFHLQSWFTEVISLTCQSCHKNLYYDISFTDNRVTLCSSKDHNSHTLIHFQKSKPSWTNPIIISLRNRPVYTKRFWADLLIKILRQAPLSSILDLIAQTIDDLLNNRVDHQQLIETRKALATNRYQKANYFMKVFIEELEKLGEPVLPDQFLSYLVVTPYDKMNEMDEMDKMEGNPLITSRSISFLLDKNSNYGLKMRLCKTYLERLNTENEEKLDIFYYLGLTTSPLCKVLNMEYHKDLVQFKTRNNICHIIKIMITIWRGGGIKGVKQWLEKITG